MFPSFNKGRWRRISRLENNLKAAHLLQLLSLQGADIDENRENKYYDYKRLHISINYEL